MSKGSQDNSSTRMKRKEYEKELRKLQTKLCLLQDWVKQEGLRVIIVFEGRDAAGKGGTIKAITERVSPRVFRVVAMPSPSDREKTQIFAQRYIQQFPSGGEVVIFDRSWYNRAGVERVMGFCTEKQYETFLRFVPASRSTSSRAVSSCSNTGSRSATRNRSVGSKRASTIPCGNGNCRLWTFLRANAGTSILGRAIACSKQPIPRNHRGISCAPTTRSGRGSTAFPTFYRAYPMSAYAGRK